MPISRIPLPNEGQAAGEHELVVHFPSTGARWPSEIVLRGADGRLGRVTTSLLLQAARRENFLPSLPTENGEADDATLGDANWNDTRLSLLRLYLEMPLTRPVEFESHQLAGLIDGLQTLTVYLADLKQHLETSEDPAALAEIALQQAENNHPDGADWGGMTFVESERTGLRVARSRQRTYFMLAMKGSAQATRVFDDEYFEYRLKNDKPSRRSNKPVRARWPVRSTIETQPRELAATITAFAARCVNANATEAYTECANKLGIRGDQSPEAVYKAMRRLVTTLRRPEFHGELRFLAEPGIDVDLLIKTVLEPNFRELS